MIASSTRNAEIVQVISPAVMPRDNMLEGCAPLRYAIEAQGNLPVTVNALTHPPFVYPSPGLVGSDTHQEEVLSAHPLIRRVSPGR